MRFIAAPAIFRWIWTDHQMEVSQGPFDAPSDIHLEEETYELRSFAGIVLLAS